MKPGVSSLEALWYLPVIMKFYFYHSGKCCWCSGSYKNTFITFHARYKCKILWLQSNDGKWLDDEHRWIVFLLLDLIAAFNTNYSCMLINRLKLLVTKLGTVINYFLFVRRAKYWCVSTVLIAKGIPQGSVLGLFVVSLQCEWQPDVPPILRWTQKWWNEKQKFFFTLSIWID